MIPVLIALALQPSVPVNDVWLMHSRVYLVLARGTTPADRSIAAASADPRDLCLVRDGWGRTTGDVGAPPTPIADLRAALAQAKPAPEVAWEAGYLREADGGVRAVGPRGQAAELEYVVETTAYPFPDAGSADHAAGAMYSGGRPLTMPEWSVANGGSSFEPVDLSAIRWEPIPGAYMRRYGVSLGRYATTAAPTFGEPFDRAVAVP